VGNTYEIFALSLSHVLGLEWSLVDGFVDFGWIFMKLVLHSLSFLDEVSVFLEFIFMLLMFMVKFLFVARNIFW
jgi:hypothetical protein